MKPFKPMLAGTLKNFEGLRFPLLVSPKLDGIRCIVNNGVALSRSLKPIPNRFVQKCLAPLFDTWDMLDGELMVGVPGKFCDVSSAIMSQDGEPDFTFEVFDYVARATYEERLRNLLGLHLGSRVYVVEHTLISNLDELHLFECGAVACGFEGVMLRDPAGPYKFGRSTEREGYLLKWKRHEDAEALIIDCIEMGHNDNAAEQNELGRTKRSSAKAGKRPAGVLGAFVVRRPDGVVFNVGGGFTMQQRKQFWNERNHRAPLLYCKYRYFPGHVEANGAPTSAVFIGIRHPDDL